MPTSKVLSSTIKATQGSPHTSSILNGYIILRVKSGSATWWFHISLMFRAPVRPTLLRMSPAPESAGEKIELQVWRSLDKHRQQKAHWLTLWQLVDMLTPPEESISKGADRRRCSLDLWRLDEMGWTVFPPCSVVVTPVVGTTREVSLAPSRPQRHHAAANTQRDTRNGSDSEIEGGEDINDDISFNDGRVEDHVTGFDTDDQGLFSDLEDVAAAWAEQPLHSPASHPAAAQPPSPHAPGSPDETSSSSSNSSGSNSSVRRSRRCRC